MPSQWWSTQFNSAERLYKQTHISKGRSHESWGGTKKDPWVLGAIPLLFLVWRKPTTFCWNQRSHGAYRSLDLRVLSCAAQTFYLGEFTVHSDYFFWRPHSLTQPWYILTTEPIKLIGKGSVVTLLMKRHFIATGLCHSSFWSFWRRDCILIGSIYPTP